MLRQTNRSNDLSHIDNRFSDRRVKCPACSGVVEIPKLASQAQSAASRPSHDALAPQVVGAASQAANTGLLGLLDEIGVEKSRTGVRCTSCKADMEPEAVLCVRCGFHVELGKHLTTVVRRSSH